MRCSSGWGIYREVGEVVENAEECAKDVLHGDNKLGVCERCEFAGCACEERVRTFVCAALFEGKFALVVGR